MAIASLAARAPQCRVAGLEDIALAMVADGKGILAADETSRP
jgi:hypothetical protein